MKNKSLKTIWIMFTVFIMLFSVNLVVKGVPAATQRMWLIMDIWDILLSMILLLKYRFPSRKGIIASAVFGLLVSLSYINTGVFSLVLAVFITVLSSLAVFSTFEKYSENRLQFVSKKKKSSVVISVVLGLSVGIIWGAINYFLMSSHNEPKPMINTMNFLVALSPAILEEIAMRTLFFAFCFLPSFIER